jgi:hypothetical protein
MVEIEFFDPGEPAPGDEPAGGEEIGRDPSRWPTPDRNLLASVLLLAAAATLAVLAPFQQLLVTRQPSGGVSQDLAVDGWGRLHLNQDAVAPPGYHFSRFGIPLVICAGLLTVLVLLLAAEAVGARVTDRMVRAGGVVVVGITGVLAGVLAGMWLFIDAQFADSRASTIDVEVGPTVPTNHYGTGIWLVAAALLATALGTGTAHRWRRAQDAAASG